jgi:acylphosphatase
MTEPAKRSVRIVVTGRVQGVGFRAFLAREATRLGLSGWARNRGFDQVEAFVAGESVAVAEFLELARRGPALARVHAIREEAVDAVASAQPSAGSGFFVAPSA